MGVTSIEMIFPCAFAYLESEQKDNYTWALTILKSVLDDSAVPRVILSDRDLALINAIKRAFPNAKHLLCRWHINKNVIAKCKKLFATK